MAPYYRRLVAKGAAGPASMHLPPEIYALFELQPLAPPSEPLDRVSAAQRESEILQKNPLDGVAAYLDRFEAWDRKKPPPSPTNSALHARVLWKEREAHKEARKRKAREFRMEKREKRARRIKEYGREWDPSEDKEGKKTRNAYNTLFLARLKRSTTEEMLRKHFEKFGKIVKIVLIPKSSAAFVEFEKEDAFKDAYQSASRSLDGHRIAIDFERGRTTKDWKPKALGGGFRPRRDHRGGSSRRSRERHGRRR